MLDDVQLVAQCRDGYLDAFGELIRRHEGRLYATLVNILRNGEDARDAVQDAFLFAYQNLEKFEGRSEFSTWLYRIGVNAAISSKRKRRPVASLELSDGQFLDPPDRSRGNEPSHALVCAEQSAAIWRALGRLPTRDRALLVLKDFDERCYQEIADLLCIPIGTVRSRLHRARMKLWRLLKDEEGSEESV